MPIHTEWTQELNNKGAEQLHNTIAQMNSSDLGSHKGAVCITPPEQATEGHQSVCVPSHVKRLNLPLVLSLPQCCQPACWESL